MKIAISNIAWPAEQDAAAYELLRENEIVGLEVAPTRVWPDWAGITKPSIALFRDQVSNAGLEISSLQSILFQKPALQLFAEGVAGEEFAEHLRYCADLAASLGAKAIVFGAPKNRLRGDLSQDEAMQRAVDVLLPIAEYYAKTGVCLCFEANPEQYGCNFMTRGADAARLVRRVGSAGLRLHLDTACGFLAGEDVAALVRENADILAHFHASEPMLGGFDAPEAHHDTVAEALRASGYQGWVAVEMRTQSDPAASLKTAAEFAVKTYGGSSR